MAKGKGKAKAKASAIAKSPPRSAKARGKEKMPVPKAKPIHFSALPTPEITGEWKVVKDLAAWDGKKECLVGTKITRSANSITWHEAQWNCAWYVWENGIWKTPSGAFKTAEPDVFDVRKIFVENAEYGFVEDDDPDWQIWKTLPAPGHRNGPK